MFKSINKFKLLEVEDLTIKIEIYSHSIDTALLESRTGEITSSTYMTSIGDIVGHCSNLGNGALLIMAIPLVLFGAIVAFTCLTRIVKIAVVISVKMVLQFYWNLKR